MVMKEREKVRELWVMGKDKLVLFLPALRTVHSIPMEVKLVIRSDASSGSSMTILSGRCLGDSSAGSSMQVIKRSSISLGECGTSLFFERERLIILPRGYKLLMKHIHGLTGMASSPSEAPSLDADHTRSLRRSTCQISLSFFSSLLILSISTSLR